MIYGSRVRLHPGIILLVLPAGAAIAGIVGVFAAVPVTVFVASLTSSVVAALDPDVELEEEPMVRNVARSRGAMGLATAGDRGRARRHHPHPRPDSARRRSRSSWRPSWPHRSPPWSVRSGVGDGATSARRWWSPAGRCSPSWRSWSWPSWRSVRASRRRSEGGLTGAGEADDASGGLLGWLGSASAEVGSSIVGAVTGIIAAISSLAVVLVLASLLTFYVLRDGRKGWERVLGPLHGWQRVGARDHDAGTRSPCSAATWAVRRSSPPWGRSRSS